MLADLETVCQHALIRRAHETVRFQEFGHAMALIYTYTCEQALACHAGYHVCFTTNIVYRRNACWMPY
jgi:hypothetical protein